MYSFPDIRKSLLTIHKSPALSWLINPKVKQNRALNKEALRVVKALQNLNRLYSHQRQRAGLRVELALKSHPRSNSMQI